jgi:TetR/AcrR family tetracycline transcriptional repressor
MTAAPARARLDRDTIVTAALALLDAEGLEGVTTRALAAILGIKGPSLYWHLGGKGELIDLMADALLKDALPPLDTPGDWRHWLAEGARGVWRAALSHRDGARLIAAARPSERRRARFSDNVARLQSAGFSAQAASTAFVALSRYALGSALGQQSSGFARDEEQRLFEEGLAAMLDGLYERLEGRK